MTPRPSTAAPILAGLLILAVPLGLYVVGYFWFGERIEQIDEWESIERQFPQQWLTTVYQPAGKVETWLRGADVYVTWSEAAPLHRLPVTIPFGESSPSR